MFDLSSATMRASSVSPSGDTLTLLRAGGGVDAQSVHATRIRKLPPSGCSTVRCRIPRTWTRPSTGTERPHRGWMGQVMTVWVDDPHASAPQV
jgi:hypothetical protein